MNEALWSVIDALGREVSPALWPVLRGQFRSELASKPIAVEKAAAALRQAVAEGRL